MASTNTRGGCVLTHGWKVGHLSPESDHMVKRRIDVRWVGTFGMHVGMGGQSGSGTVHG
jgi:hypothetical protein